MTSATFCLSFLTYENQSHSWYYTYMRLKSRLFFYILLYAIA